MIYNKPALTYPQQLELLEKRGLTVEDEQEALKCLSNISYYRLSAYMIPFKEKDGNNNVTDTFKKETTWEDVYGLYKFDRKLRLLVFDAIERIEVSLRTKLIYQLSLKYGPHWQSDKDLFCPPKVQRNGKTYSAFDDIQKHIKDQLNANNKAVFIKHYQAKYDEPAIPPSWMCVELLYFSELSKICQSLKSRSDRTMIAKSFALPDDKIFCSWLHTLNYIRNICAHHARLWNINVDITPTKYENKTNLKWLTADENKKAQSSRLYYTLCIILYLLQTVNPETSFPERFKGLLKEYPIVDESYMGFPKGWKEQELWNI